MTTVHPDYRCPGCNQHIEPLAAIRIYHGQCDPWGRMEHLERVLAQVHDWLKPNGSVMRGDQLCIAPHGWDVIRQSVAAALDRPVQMKGRE